MWIQKSVFLCVCERGRKSAGPRGGLAQAAGWAGGLASKVYNHGKNPSTTPADYMIRCIICSCPPE